MISTALSGKLLTVKDGYLLCPHCLTARINSHLLKVEPDTVAVRLPVYCRRCKQYFKVDIASGQCFDSRCR